MTSQLSTSRVVATNSLQRVRLLASPAVGGVRRQAGPLAQARRRYAIDDPVAMTAVKNALDFDVLANGTRTHALDHRIERTTAPSFERRSNAPRP